MSTMDNKHIQGLSPYLSPAAAWSMALGTSIGWGSLVVTGSTYLAQAGPMGSVLGMVIGAAIMIIISRNYYYMMDCIPEAGGAYAYSRDTFGYDHGFLTAWFLSLTYLAILWANVTSLPLFARYFIGNYFEFGYMYSLFDYKVYFGEVILSAGALVLAGILCVSLKKGIAYLMTGMVALFCLGITFCFAVALLRLDLPGASAFSPAYVPDSHALSQVIRIACISPWAFIGFENISHASEEFVFHRNKVFRILLTAVIVTTLLYIFVTLLSVTAYPPQYASWLDYIRDRGNLSGIEGLPAFYAARHYMGDGGIMILMAVLLCLIITSLIGNILALSRLFYSLARDRILPGSCAQLNQKGIPYKAIYLILAVSLLIPFVGRTAIGWIVDVTTIGATIIYGFVSACAWKTADFRGDKTEKATGLIGLILMIAVGAYILVPNLFTAGTIETETYFLFIIWAILGFFYFRLILRKDEEGKFGYSIVVWIGLLSLVLFVALVWMSQNNMNATTKAMSEIQEYYNTLGVGSKADNIIMRELEVVRSTNARSILVVISLMALSLTVLLNNYALMSRRARESERELGSVREMANKDPLTGVKSKHAYAEQELYLNRTIKEGSQEAFGLLVCDVNGLKYINDTLGHKAGDEYIKSAGRLICEIYMHSPVFRIGGDEFVILLEGRDHDNRTELLRSLNRRVEENIGRNQVVIAAGMAEYELGRDESLHQVFERADRMMYERKQQLKGMGARTRG